MTGGCKMKKIPGFKLEIDRCSNTNQKFNPIKIAENGRIHRNGASFFRLRLIKTDKDVITTNPFIYGSNKEIIQMRRMTEKGKEYYEKVVPVRVVVKDGKNFPYTLRDRNLMIVSVVEKDGTIHTYKTSIFIQWGLCFAYIEEFLSYAIQKKQDIQIIGLDNRQALGEILIPLLKDLNLPDRLRKSLPNKPRTPPAPNRGLIEWFDPSLGIGMLITSSGAGARFQYSDITNAYPKDRKKANPVIPIPGQIVIVREVIKAPPFLRSGFKFLAKGITI
jgi:hypothetical protein